MKKDSVYIGVMFPYPSGSGLHIGHMYNYSIMDSYANWLKFKGIDTFQPFGYDAFGLPAENYAKKVGRDPRDVTDENIEKFRQQMFRMNTNFEELLVTSDYSYYKWSQWIFLELKKKGLAYKATGEVNYCPSCETVLANEQVVDKKCERCKSEIILKTEEQWYFKITDYAERLLNNLDKIDYPKSTIKQQREWIGRSEGYEINFGHGITVFTTKPETILDVKFIVTHSDNGREAFTGQYGICPVTQKKIPVYTSNYVIKGYGTGYVMGVPNDDTRDRNFAVRHNIPFDEEKNIITNSVIIDDIAIKKVNYKLHDWCVSRQRKWGTPIPIHTENDTLDTFVDSSFYYIRYCDPNNPDKLAEFDKIQQVDLYVGGNEHACMHLIYARFINMFLYDIGVTPFEEPFKKVIHQGMITKDGSKMSKTTGNVVDPDNYDPDELRMYLMFIGHYFDGGDWNDQNIAGIRRFINRMNKWVEGAIWDGISIDTSELVKTLDGYFNSFKFNKVISSLMEFYNANKKTVNIDYETADKLISIMRVVAPNFKRN